MPKPHFKITLKTLFICLVFFCSNLFAEVYKWTDSTGQVHFGDRPIGNVEAMPVKIHGSTTGSISSERQLKRKKLLSVFEEERQEESQKKLTLSEQKRERKSRCEAAEKQLAEYETAGFLYRLNEQGEQIVLDDVSHQKAMDDAREQVRAWCG